MEAVTMKYNETKKLSRNTFSKENSSFVGWNTEPDGSGTSFVDEESVTNLRNVDGSIITLYAQWTSDDAGGDDTGEEDKILYYIKYNANGGFGTMINSTHTYGIPKKLTKNVFVREGYKFIGWNTEADGSGTTYLDEQLFNEEEITKGGTIFVLYAQWEEIEEEIPDSPITGSLPLILVSFIGLGALISLIYHYKKVRV